MKKKLRVIIYSISAVLVVASLALAYDATNISRKPILATVAVKREDVVHSIAVTGAVKAETDVDLAFERGGTVSRVYANVGDKVSAGQVIASLSSADLVAQLAQAQAGQAAAEAKLASLKRGARSEVVGVQDSSVHATETAVTESKNELVDKLQDAHAKADDAIHGASDQFYTDATGTLPRLSFFIPDDRLVQDLGSRRILMESMLHDWQASADQLTATSDLDAAVTTAKQNLDVVSAFLDDDVVALDKFDVSSNPSVDQLTVDGYKANISIARANINAASAALTAGVEKLAAAKSALDIATSQKTLQVAAPAAEDVDVLQAEVQQAAAAVDAANVQLGKASLRSPVNGVISRQDAKVGATATPGMPVVTVLSQGVFEIETVVPEADIAVVAKGNDALVTLDAYGTGVPFTASVATVDPAQTTIDGMTGYKVTLRFASVDGRIKSGMTANVKIIAATHQNAIAVSRDAVITRDGNTFVLLVIGGRTQEQQVKLGLTGEDGNVEVLEGLQEGDQVANFGK